MDTNFKNIVFVVAMIEEFEAIKTFFKNTEPFIKHPFIVYKNAITINNKQINMYAVISKIGKSASASATTYAICNYNPDLIINIGSSGGVNNTKINDIIISNTTGFFDCDVSAFGYKTGQMAQQPEYFVSSFNKFDQIVNKIQNNFSNIALGTVITGDSFINNINKVNEIKYIYNNTVAIEMEASSIALVCNTFNVPFLLVKKVSDMADSKANESFKDNINNINTYLSEVVNYLINEITINL